MSEPSSSFDLNSAVAALAGGLVIVAVIIQLLPVFLNVVWQALPSVLVLWLLVTLLRAIVAKLLG